MSEFLNVVGWERFQHYRDRCPPWIKLHASVLHDYAFSCLRDASKAHLMLIWVLASRTGNKLPNDPSWIQRQIGSKVAPDLKELVSAGFLAMSQDASAALAGCEQLATPRASDSDSHSASEVLSLSSPNPEEDEFGVFWKRYPRKVGRDAAEKVWRKKNPPIEQVEAALDWQIPSAKWREDGGKYIPHPATYLNQGRWKDERPDESTIHESPEPKSAKAFRDLRRKYGQAEAVDAEVIE